MVTTKHTPGPWQVVKSFNGFVVTRTWTSGFYQRMRTGHLHTEAEAREAIETYGAGRITPKQVEGMDSQMGGLS